MGRADELIQVLRPGKMGVWHHRGMLALGVVGIVLAVLYLVDQVPLLGWSWAVMGVGSLVTARVTSLRVVLSSQGITRERLIGGYTRVTWSEVQQVRAAPDRPGSGTGGMILLASGRQLRLRGWDAEGVEQAVDWWLAAR